MSYWEISEGCIVNDDSGEHAIIKNGTSITVGENCWIFLIGLLNAKKRARGTGELGVLPDEIAYRSIWGNKQVDVLDGLTNVRKQLVKIIGTAALKKQNNVGYYFTYDVHEVAGNKIGLEHKAYFETLWRNHYKGASVDRTIDRELITYFILPAIDSENQSNVKEPFARNESYKYVTAGSGYGKSTLLDMILLSNIAAPLKECGSQYLGDNSVEKIEAYEQIRKALFGHNSPYYVPVFIHSNKANGSLDSLISLADYGNAESIIQYAEGGKIEGFSEIILQAEKEGKLIFLIEALDEVKRDSLNDYIRAINKMFEMYPNSMGIITSRSLGNRHLPFEHETLSINKLSEGAVFKIAEAIYPGQGKVIIDEIIRSPWLKDLTSNPFVLMKYLRYWQSLPSANDLLNQITNDIIGRRWQIHHEKFNAEYTKLLLGFLACNYVFGNKQSTDIFDVRQVFLKACEEIPKYIQSFNISSTDIDEFLSLLSRQSGILNVYIEKDNSEKFVFQENYIKCWLAADYICCIMRNEKTITEKSDIHSLLSNALFLDRFIYSSSKDNNDMLSSDAVLALVFSVSIINRQRKPSVLYFLILKYLTSSNDVEKANILQGFQDITKKTYGISEIEPRDYVILNELISTQV